MIKIIIISLLFFASSACSGGDKKYFVCDFVWNGPKESYKMDPNITFDGVFHGRDIIFYYEKTDSGQYKTHFPLYGGTELGLQLNGDILSNAYLNAPTSYGFYREKFDIYQFNFKTKIFTHSYFYYVDPEKDLSSFRYLPDFKKSHNPYLASLINREAPENDLKIGFDKTKWQCYEIPYFKYLRFKLEDAFFTIFND
ncbi:MAG: hypothetical protein OXM55_06815 [Bdellovibrionales bacterium]|nr:hypothetical protein [Bdellovibrionales bacterium]